MPRPHSAPRGRVRQLKPWNANAVHTERHAWDPPANSLCQQRHLQDHLRRHPAPSGCLPRGRLRRFPLHQHLSNDPRYVLPTPPPNPGRPPRGREKKEIYSLRVPRLPCHPCSAPKPATTVCIRPFGKLTARNPTGYIPGIIHALYVIFKF